MIDQSTATGPRSHWVGPSSPKTRQPPSVACRQLIGRADEIDRLARGAVGDHRLTQRPRARALEELCQALLVTIGGEFADRGVEIQFGKVDIGDPAEPRERHVQFFNACSLAAPRKLRLLRRLRDQWRDQVEHLAGFRIPAAIGACS